MTIKQMIQAEIDKVDEKSLKDLYLLIQEYVAAKENHRSDIMTKLKGIAIEAPADFAANFDAYASGDKRVGEDLH
jgi:hypothetical protein